MSLDPEFIPRQNLGSLQSCLVEGDPQQRARERSARRKALTTSVLLQLAVLVALILVPLFAKPARLVTAIATPIPPYRREGGRSQAPERPHSDVTHICVTCFNAHPATLDRRTRVELSNPEQEDQGFGQGEIPAVPCPSCINIPTAGPQAPTVSEPRTQKPQLVVTQINPAMLVHRVEPVYPTLAKQLGRPVRVELRALIATDGTIQSLEVVSGDALFYQSAMDAVRQWRYRPTILNGEAVEIDTFITVIYNISH
jgi:periplasmic protein TonB